MFILKILYNLLIALIVPFAVPFGYLIALRKKEDEDYFERYGFITFPEPPERTVWFHCASVGEVRSLKSVMEFIKDQFPGIKIIVSTTTATGKKMANTELEPYYAFLLPLENSMSISHIIDYMNVKAVFIVDTELWPNMIRVSGKKSRLFLINGRISDRTFRSYMKFRFIFRRLLSRFETIYTKSEADTEKFAGIKGTGDGIVTLGNIKFQSRAEKIDSGIFNFLKSHKVFAAASTHGGEEETVLQAFRDCSGCDRLVLAPRHINRIQEAVKLAKDMGFTVSLLAERDGSCDVTIVDRFGTLEELYAMADKIYIGGSMNGTGGHNIFEALQFEKHVSTGPNMSNFQEISDLAHQYGVSATVKDAAELTAYIDSEQTGADFQQFFAALDSDRNKKLSYLKGVLESVSAD